MLKFKQYVRPDSLEDAYQLAQKKKNLVIGGMLWLKMTDRNCDTAIDLCGLGLDKIEETEDAFSIGAMVSLRSLETNREMDAYFNGAFRESVEHIVGVQFRNCATVGGSLWGRFGFSDVLTVFLALDASVELYHAGVMKLSEFAAMPRKTRDILVRVIVPKNAQGTVYMSQRNTSTDFPVLTCAVSKSPDGYRYVIGARPGVAKCISSKELMDVQEIAKQFVYSGNLRASAEYRARIAEVLLKRSLKKLAEI